MVVINLNYLDSALYIVFRTSFSINTYIYLLNNDDVCNLKVLKLIPKGGK